MNLYNSLPTLTNSNLSMFASTSSITLFKRFKVHLSHKFKWLNFKSLYSKSSSIFIKTNLAEFQILLIKFHDASSFSGIYLKSIPGAEFVVKKNLNVSAPYWSITSIGSTPLPNDLDIFLPCSSRIKPWIKTCSNGLWPVNSNDWKIIRLTQKKIISYPVTKVFVGKYLLNKGSSVLGQPNVENGHNALENQVSKTSSSCVQFSISSGAVFPT